MRGIFIGDERPAQFKQVEFHRLGQFA
jgi:hypothetical protein